MLRIGIVFIGLAISTSLSTKVSLLPKEPAGQVAEVYVAEGAPLTITCATKDKQPLGWLFNGDEKHLLLVREERRISSLHTPYFDPNLYAGYYECFEPDSQKSDAVRVFPLALPLPRGYEKCSGKQNNYCDKGQCGVHLGLGHTDCFCFRGWSGKHCDQAVTVHRRTRHLSPPN